MRNTPRILRGMPLHAIGTPIRNYLVAPPTIYGLPIRYSLTRRFGTLGARLTLVYMVPVSKNTFTN